MGYAKPTIPLEFPELSADPENDLITVTIRNPRLLTQDSLVTVEGVKLGPDGKPDLSAVDLNLAKAATLENIANVIVGWHVYDATDLSDDPQPMELPATAEKVAKLPRTILNTIGEHLKAITNPPA